MRIIANAADLLELFDVDSFGELDRAIYEQTECGAWIRSDESSVTIGTMVEGSDAEVTTALAYPFVDEALFDALMWLEDVADKLWVEANPDVDDEIV